jgi:hypothetical protein
MIVRHDATADTYMPLLFTYEALRRLKKAFRDHAPHLELDLGHTDTGMPFLTVAVPGDDFDDAPAVITRGERGWQMVRGGDGPLYEFATAREVAEFLGVRGSLVETPLGVSLKKSAADLREWGEGGPRLAASGQLVERSIKGVSRA